MVKDIAFGIIISLLFISLVVLFCVIIIKLYVQKIKKYNKELYQKDLDHERNLNTTIVETQEQVLQNISQELHDDAGQQLTVINFQLENLKLDSQELHSALMPISQSVTALSKSIRSISHSLNNQLLSQQNLVKAIETEANRLQENTTLQVHFFCEDSIAKTFSANEKIVLYRIFQEITNNILKHANATTVNIELKTNPKFEMKISDNGKGFDLQNISNKKLSLGLQNIVNRAKIINYNAELFSEINIGTTIIIVEK
jgi:signal transduction histidine kinase